MHLLESNCSLREKAGGWSGDLNIVSCLSIPVSSQFHSEEELHSELFLALDNISDHPEALLFVQNDNKVTFQGELSLHTIIISYSDLSL